MEFGGVLEDGTVFQYRADVADGEPGSQHYDMPGLLGMPHLQYQNMFIGCRHDMLYMVPIGMEDERIWLRGTQKYPCERAPSGHMMLVLSHFNRFKGKEEATKKMAHWRRECALGLWEKEEQAKL